MILGRKKSETKSEAKAKAPKKEKNMTPAQLRNWHYDVIISPVITEKSTAASEQGKFLFNVRQDASKQDVKQAVEGLFNVKVAKVNTHNRMGKIKRFRNTMGRRQDTKKAIVTLAAGQSIDFSTGVKK